MCVSQEWGVHRVLRRGEGWYFRRLPVFMPAVLAFVQLSAMRRGLQECVGQMGVKLLNGA